MRLRLPVLARADRRVDVERMVRDERVEVAARVRDEPDLQAVLAERRQDRQRVLVELEVVRVLPGAGHLEGALVRAVLAAAHALDDALR